MFQSFSLCCLSTLISTRARTFLCGRCSESSDNDTPIYHFARYLLQFVRIFSRTYCTVKPVFTYYILHITVPPDRYLLHFFFPLSHLVMSPILIKLEISALRRVRQVDSLFTQAQWLVLSLSSILLIVLSEILLRC